MLRDSDVEFVKSAVSMKELASMYGYKVNRSGMMCCPFHGDTNPSMKVYGGTLGYYCFVCNEGGDIFHFVMHHDGLKFEPAVRRIAEMFGIAVTDGKSELTPEEKAAIAERRRKAEASEEKKRQDRKRMSELADEISLLNDIISIAEPFGPMFCVAMDRREKLEAEWKKLFDKN